MSWRKALLAIACTPLCAVYCNADPIDAQLDSVRNVLAKGDSAAALVALDQVVNPTPAQLLRARYYHAYVRYQQKDRAAAEAELLALLPRADGPLSDRAAFVALGGAYGEKASALLGAVYNESGRFDLLIPLYRTMQMDYPTNAEWPYVEADALFATGRYSEAAARYRKCVNERPDYARAKDARFRVIESLRSAQRYQEAYDAISDIPLTDIDSEIRAAALKAELLAKYLHKDYDLALEICTSMVAKYPDDPSIFHCRCQLAYLYLTDLPPGRRDYAKARGMLEQIIRDYPKDAMVFEMKLGIANAYFYEGNMAKAIAEYRALLAAYPDNYPKDNWHAFTRFMMACAYRAGNDSEAASSVFNSIINDYPGDCWAQLAKTHLTISAKQ